MSNRLNYLNYCNVVAFLGNIIITYGFGMAGWGGTQSNSDLSNKYQTIVTPIGWAFSIWSLIFITEAIFTVAQTLPRFRSSPMVQEGIKFWFILACFFQILWTIVFGYEIIWLSLLVILLIALSLVSLLVSQYYTKSDENKILEYCLMQFPFQMHCGWLIAASVVNANVVIVSEGHSAAYQLTSGIVSLAILLAVATFVLFAPNRPNYVVPLVLSWASGGVASELKNPATSIARLFSTDIIEATKNAAASISILILIMVGLRLSLFVLARFSPFFSMFGCGEFITDHRIATDSEVVSKNENDPEAIL